jgi:hypothetical protein
MLQTDEAQCGFETRNFYLACFVGRTGYELLDLRADDRRKVFARRHDVLAFYGEGAAGPPLAFSSTIMKALLHNA